MADQSAVRTNDTTGAPQPTATPIDQGRRAGGLPPVLVLVGRLALVGAAVLATLTQAGPAVQAPLWLAAAAAVALGFRRDALDLLARSLGLGAVALILLGPLLQAAGLKLWPSTWAIAVGALAAIAIVVEHVRAGSRPDPVLAQPVNRRSLLWGSLAALVAVGAVIGAGISGRLAAPDVEMWLVNPDQAQPTAAAPQAPAGQGGQAGQAGQPGKTATAPAAAPTQVQVAVRAADDIADARLSVTSLGPIVAVPYAPTPTPSGGPAAGAPAPQTAPAFSVAAGETVQQTVTVPPTGRVEIRLSSASRPGLDRTLILNR